MPLEEQENYYDALCLYFTEAQLKVSNELLDATPFNVYSLESKLAFLAGIRTAYHVLEGIAGEERQKMVLLCLTAIAGKSMPKQKLD